MRAVSGGEEEGEPSSSTHLWVDKDALNSVLLVPDRLSQGRHVVLPDPDL